MARKNFGFAAVAGQNSPGPSRNGGRNSHGPKAPGARLQVSGLAWLLAKMYLLCGQKTPCVCDGGHPKSPGADRKGGLARRLGLGFCSKIAQTRKLGIGASTERHHASQSTAARRRALLQSATTPARAQQHGGVGFYRAPPRQPEHSSTAACASAERHHASQSATRAAAGCDGRARQRRRCCHRRFAASTMGGWGLWSTRERR